MPETEKVVDGVDGFDDPFHEGEVAVQERTGERAFALHAGSCIRDALVPGARMFLSMQNTIALGTTDADGRLWAGLWLGWPGFARSEDGRTVHMQHPVSSEDPLGAQLAVGRDIGLLPIDLASRRRLRINGTVVALDAEGLALRVREAFPNCPKYIQRRELSAHLAERVVEPRSSGHVLGEAQRALVGRIDTFFVASRHPKRGVDVSHRGGASGFVRVLDDRTLRVPDYIGNGMFQTMGNFEVEPRAGIVMVDFERGRFLSMTGTVTMSFGREIPSHPSGGTERYWQLGIEEWIETAVPEGFNFHYIDSSPFNPLDNEASAASCLLRS